MVTNGRTIFVSGGLGWLQMVGQYLLAVGLDGYKCYNTIC